MAVDVCTEISSPRISFSDDLNSVAAPDNHNPRSDPNPTVDFDFGFGFGFGQCLPHELSSADELFANGKILPVEIKRINNPPRVPGPLSAHSQPGNTPDNAVVYGNDTKKKKRLIEFLSNTLDAEDEEEKATASKPFWHFKRSISENGRANGLLRSLQFLTRSNSTGSVPSPKPAGLSKAIQKQHSLKEGSINRRSNSSSASSLNQCYYYPYNNNMASKKASLKQSRSRSYGNNGVRVLNIPPAYIARGTVSLFGSFFCSKKSKKKR